MNFFVSYPYIPDVMYFEMYSYFYLLYICLFFRVLFLCIMLVMLNKSNQIKFVLILYNTDVKGKSRAV